MALAGGALATLGVAALRLLAFRVGAIHDADAQVLHGFATLDRPALHPIERSIAGIADPVPYGLLGCLLIGAALAQGRVRVAAAVALILLGAAVTTDYILKPALAAPRYAVVLADRQVSSAAFPSGHATASMSLALCAILVATPRWRPYVAALGAAFAVAVSYAFLAIGWHYPSDVLGGYLVAAAWTGFVVAAMRAADARWPEHTGRRAAGRVLSHVPARVFTFGAAALLLLAVLALAAIAPDRAVHFVRVHTLFSVGAGAIALAGLTVAGVLAAILRDH